MNSFFLHRDLMEKCSWVWINFQLPFGQCMYGILGVGCYLHSILQSVVSACQGACEM